MPRLFNSGADIMPDPSDFLAGKPLPLMYEFARRRGTPSKNTVSTSEKLPGIISGKPKPGLAPALSAAEKKPQK